MCKWKQNQEKKAFKDDKQVKRFHAARCFENCSRHWAAARPELTAARYLM